MTAPYLTFRHATTDDVSTIVQMMSDDPLAARRERFHMPLPAAYIDAFHAIDREPNNEFVVATIDEDIVGFLQITFIPYLSYQGRWRALVEGVRVNKKFRSHGIGRQLMQWAISRARERHCRLVQLTTDKQRPDAIKFYESLGFRATHEGMKLHLDP